MPLLKVEMAKFSAVVVQLSISANMLRKDVGGRGGEKAEMDRAVQEKAAEGSISSCGGLFSAAGEGKGGGKVGRSPSDDEATSRYEAGRSPATSSAPVLLQTPFYL